MMGTRGRRAIQRFIIRACIFLLLGAILNIALAWALVSPLNPLSFAIRRAPPALGDEYLLLRGVYWERAGHSQSEHEWGLPIESAGNKFPVGPTILAVAGLPLPAVFSRGYNEDSVRVGSSMIFWQVVKQPHRFSGGIALSMRTGVDMPVHLVLPYRPMWPGFAINTLFYAAILWLLFTAPFALRRWRRIRRGLCEACAYPVGESARCTECGKPVNGREAN